MQYTIWQSCMQVCFVSEKKHELKWVDLSEKAIKSQVYYQLRICWYKDMHCLISVNDILYSNIFFLM